MDFLLSYYPKIPEYHFQNIQQDHIFHSYWSLHLLHYYLNLDLLFSLLQDIRYNQPMTYNHSHLLSRMMNHLSLDLVAFFHLCESCCQCTDRYQQDYCNMNLSLLSSIDWILELQHLRLNMVILLEIRNSYIFHYVDEYCLPQITYIFL